MGQAKKRGTYEERVQKAIDDYAKNSHKCTVYTDVKYRGQSIFDGVGECLIPDEVPKDKFGSKEWEQTRNKHFSSLANLEMYDQNKGESPKVILGFVGRYLQHSLTLHMARNFPFLKAESNTCARTGHEHIVDLDDLGCVLEYELKDHPKSVTGVSINTLGPRWMRSADVIKEAKSKGLMKETA